MEEKTGTKGRAVTDANLNAITFTDQNIGIAVGEQGKILLTTDGGVSWENKGISEFNYFYGVDILEFNTAIVVGIPFAAGPQLVIRTTNGGYYLGNLNTGTTEPLSGISFENANTGLVAGQNGIIMMTTDSGNTWSNQTSNTDNLLIDIKFIGNNSASCGR